MTDGRFSRFVAIDWSGANVERPPGLAVGVAANGDAAPFLLKPARGWSRPSILAWLLHQADAGANILVGMDLSPALPFVDEGAYFPGWPDSPPDAHALWRLVDERAGAAPHLAIGGLLDAPEIARHFRQLGRPGERYPAGRGRLRVCEAGQLEQGLSPTSCFNLVGAAQVGKSSLTGMRLFHRLGGRIPVWPINPLPASGPAIVEIYTSIAAREAGIRRGLSKMRDAAALDAALAALGSAPHAPLAAYSDHATDALLTAAWLRRVADDAGLWAPAALTPPIARTEGWTFGVR